MKRIKTAFSILFIFILLVSVMALETLALENESCCSSNDTPCIDCRNDSIVYRAIGKVPRSWEGIELLRCHHVSVPAQEDNVPANEPLNVLRWYYDGVDEWYYVASPSNSKTLYGWVHEDNIIIEQVLTSLD